MLDIPALEITNGKRTVNNLQVKRCVGVLSSVFKPGHGETLKKATDAIR